jgi:hypothetical protein
LPQFYKTTTIIIYGAFIFIATGTDEGIINFCSFIYEIIVCQVQHGGQWLLI